jgi:hypothetical protein
MFCIGPRPPSGECTRIRRHRGSVFLQIEGTSVSRRPDLSGINHHNASIGVPCCRRIGESAGVGDRRVKFAATKAFDILAGSRAEHRRRVGSLWRSGSQALRLRKLAIDGEEDAAGGAEVAYQQRLSTALTGPPERISRSSARRSPLATVEIPRAKSHRARVLRPCRGRDAPRGGQLRGALV